MILLDMLCDEWLAALTSSSICGLEQLSLFLSELICVFPSLFHLQRHSDRGLVKVLVVEEMGALIRLGDIDWY